MRNREILLDDNVGVSFRMRMSKENWLLQENERLREIVKEQSERIKRLLKRSHKKRNS